MRRHFSRMAWIALLSVVMVCGGCSDDASGNGENHGQADVNSGGRLDTGEEDLDVNEARDPVDHEDPDAEYRDVPPIEEGCVNHYQRVCGGDCVNIKIDPDNCGACGTVCGEGEACAGGACASACGNNEQICDRQCVNVQSDSNHCGGCGIVCEEGTGCNGGVCVPALDLSKALECEGGGPPVQFDWDGVQDRCSGEVAEAAFRWAMCSCSSTSLTGGLKTDAFDSLQGPYVPGALGGGVGINGSLKSTQAFDIGGSLWVGDTSDGALNAHGTVHIDMRVGGRASITGGLDVGGDAAVGSYNAGGSTFAVGGTLTVPADGAMGGNSTYQVLERAPVQVPMPCACEEEQIIPIAAMIEGRRTDNDNALIDLDADALRAGSTVRRLDLPCGSYFLRGIDSGGDLTIMAHGRTALYIQGNVKAQRLTIKAMPGAELDVFIDGDVHTGGLVFGSQHYPAATRLYLGGDEGLIITQGVDIGGFVYAYPGAMHFTSNVEVFGGVFGNQISVTQPLAVHYDRQIQRVGDSCPGEEPEEPTPGEDVGVPGEDAGDDVGVPPGDTGGEDPDPPVDQCVEFEGSCSESSDCCAPMLCSQGQCGLNRCLVGGESCVYSSDCCSQLCAIAAGETSGVCITQ